MIIVYCAKSILTGKSYVGQTKDLKIRKQGHRYDALRQKKEGPLYEEIRINGFDSLCWTVLAECPSRGEAYMMEELYTKSLRSDNPEFGFNRKPGNRLVTKTKKALLDSHLGVRTPEEVKEKIASSLRGVVFSKDHRSRLAQAGRKRVTTPELRKALSEGQKKRREREKGEKQ